MSTEKVPPADGPPVPNLLAMPSADAATTVDSEADSLFEEFDAQPAQIADGEADRIDADFCGIGNQRSRRAALATLEMSGAQLTATVTGDRMMAVALADAADAIKGYAEQLRGFAKIMDTASMRIRLALCNREDMQTVIAEARGQKGRTL